MPIDRTHDISNTAYHVKDVKALGKILTDAGSAAFPNRGRSRYREAHVLLLSWEDDNLGVINEVTELEDVFRQCYSFGTEEWKIPSKRPHNTLASKILEFSNNYEGKDSLLIVYYGGHGLMNDDRQCIWSWLVIHLLRFFDSLLPLSVLYRANFMSCTWFTQRLSLLVCHIVTSQSVMEYSVEVLLRATNVPSHLLGPAPS